MSTIKNVIVAGASGNLGPFIVSTLHSSGFTISALTRPTSTKAFPPYVTSVPTDYSLPSLISAFQGQDAVISVLGLDGFSLQKQMIDAAEQTGVQRYVPSEFGWSKDIPVLPELALRLKPKDEVFDYLVETCKKSQTLSWSAIATGPFLEWCITVVPTLGFNVTNHSARIFDSGNEPIACSTGEAVGQAAAGMLLHADETKNRYLKTRCVQFTQNECLAVLEEVTDAKWDVSKISTKDVRDGIKGKVAAKRFQEAFLDVLAVQLFEDGVGRGVHVAEGESDNELLGVKEESLVEILRRLVESQRIF